MKINLRGGNFLNWLSRRHLNNANISFFTNLADRRLGYTIGYEGVNLCQPTNFDRGAALIFC